MTYEQFRDYVTNKRVTYLGIPPEYYDNKEEAENDERLKGKQCKITGIPIIDAFDEGAPFEENFRNCYYDILFPLPGGDVELFGISGYDALTCPDGPEEEEVE